MCFCESFIVTTFRTIIKFITGLIFMCLAFPSFVKAQSAIPDLKSVINELYNISKTLYPANDEYVNGFLYPVSNSRIIGDPYFETTDWFEATLFINNRYYPQISIKYNLIVDEIIIKTKTEQKIERIIVINKSQVDSFKIGSLVFVNSRNLFPDEEKNTFYEKIYQGKLSVFRHYYKRFIDTYNSTSPFGKYSAQKYNMYLFDNDNLIEINNKKSFLNNFEKPDHVLINKYLKSNKIKYKKISASQVTDLMKYCEKFTSD